MYGSQPTSIGMFSRLLFTLCISTNFFYNQKSSKSPISFFIIDTRLLF